MQLNNRKLDPVQWAWIGGLLILALIFMQRALIPPEGYALGGLDIRGLFYPWLSEAREAVRSGRLPFWDPNQFSGYPFLANPQVGLFYPPTWLALLLPVRIGISLYVMLHLWLAGIGMLLFVRHLRRSWLGAGISALAYMFSGFMAARIYAGHIGVIATYTWLPWLLLASAWAMSRGDVWSAVIAGAPFGLAILAGHTTSLIYVGVAWFGFALHLALTSGRWLLVIRQVGISILIGLFLSAVQMLPFLQAVSLSARAASPDVGFAALFSMPHSHLIALISPQFFGEPITVGYWNTLNYEEFVYYAGVLSLLGLGLSLRKPNSLTWYSLGLILVGLFLALGMNNPVYRSLYDSIFRFERVPARAAYLFTFGSSLLIGDRTSAIEHNQLRPIWVVIAGVLILIVGMVGARLVIVSSPAEEITARLNVIRSSLTVTLIVLVIGVALLSAYAAIKNMTLKSGLAVGLIALTLTDLWRVGFRLVRTEPTTPAAIWTEARSLIGETERRVLPWGVSIFEQNGAGQVGLNSVFGYNALEVAAYQAFAASAPDPRSAAYDVLGVRYVVAGGPLDDYTQGERALRLVGNSPSAWVYERARGLELARLVYQIEVITAGDPSVERIHAPDFDSASTAILSGEPPCEIGPLDAAGSARIVSHQPEQWVSETRSAAPALLVLSETAYPGWQVTVDGQPAQLLTAYTAIRAVCVPAGSHEVIWTYRPGIYWLGGVISLSAFTLVVAAVIASGRNKSGQQTPEGETA